MDKPVGLREHVELARYTSTSAFCNHTSCLSRLCHRLIAESSFLSFHLEYRCERDICFLCGNHSRHLSAAALSDGPDGRDLERESLDSREGRWNHHHDGDRAPLDVTADKTKDSCILFTDTPD